ncbi:MAG TPA: alpha/beta fold hydrolase [Ferrovibrio sp.]|uniref:alpha/beta fold hydrolase n=1 Tax=Ferrovibrio sp. TaxID=1917215 RepID=UPI002ED15A2B
MTRHLLFLPGASGAASFWHPLGALLPQAWRKTYLSWPGLGDEPHVPGLDSLETMATHAARHLSPRSALVAQSMGGIVAMRLALQYPERVSHLVLAASSGGIPLEGFDAADWRAEYRRDYPRAAEWITRIRPDHAAALPRVAAPVLLLWGDADPISPVAVGRRLLSLLPNARLQVFAGGDHGFARGRADEIAPLVRQFIGETIAAPAKAGPRLQE